MSASRREPSLTLVREGSERARPVVSEEGWFGGEGDLVRYRNPTIEGVESSWTELDAREDDVYLRRGAIADAVSRAGVYGRGDLATFAGRMNVALSTVHDYLATYRRLARLESSRRARVLALDVRYGHYRAANGVPDDDEVTYEYFLTTAAVEGWIVGRLANEVTAWRVARSAVREQERDTKRDAERSDTSTDTPDATPDTLPLRTSESVARDLSGTDEAGGWTAGEEPHFSAGRGPDRGPDRRTDRDRSLVEGFLGFLEQHDMEIGVWRSAREGEPLQFVPFDDGTGFVEGLIGRYVAACTSERG